MRAPARRAGWLLFAAFVVAAVVATVAGMSRPAPLEPLEVLDALWAWSFLGFPLTGALIVSRAPRRPLGWLFLGAPVAVMAGVAFSEFAEAAAARGSGGAAFAWWSNASFYIGLVGIAYVPLLLPDGNLPSPRWRKIAALLLVTSAVVYLVTIFSPGPMLEFQEWINPMGMDALRPVAGLAAGISGPLWLFTFLLGIASLMLRLRRARGDERLQIRWIALGGSAIVVCFLGITVVEQIFGDLSDSVVTIPIIAAILAFPMSIGVAILKHRLYDIDVIVNRTLVYAVLTAVLVGAYAVGVLVFRTVLDPVTGDNDLAIAASTLAVAGLFGPARRRIQSFIDRRFYRSRYDARRTLEEFASRLGDEVDLDTLSRDVIEVVSGTVKPRHVSILLVTDGRA